jgi:uncharacterized protein
MKTIPTPKTRTSSWLLWALVATASGIPSLLADSLGADRLLVGTIQIGVLLALAAFAFVSPQHRSVRPPATVLTLLGSFFHIGLNWLRDTEVGVSVFTDGALWRQLAAWQVISTVASVALFGVLRRWGHSDRQMFLAAGTPKAPASPIRWLGLTEPKPWTSFGKDLAIVLTGATLLFVWLGGGYDDMTFGSLRVAVPMIAVFSAINAANEEFQTRNSIVATFEPLTGGATAALISAFIFGSWHFAGTPGGVVGAAMAGLAGWLWARSMIETRGMLTAWLLHFLQDVVIFAALLS